MIEFHFRHCDCETCMPGHPAQMTRVYRVRANASQAALAELRAERAKRRHRARYRALRLAGYSWAEAQRLRVKSGP